MRSRKALINIISSLILQIISIICGFMVPKLIISKYGSSVNGLVTSITQFLAFITLMELGFGPVIKSVLYKPIANKDKDSIKKILKASEKIFRNISYIFLLYIVGLCIILPFVIAKEFEVFYTVSLIIVIAISTFAEYFWGMTYSLYIQAEQKKYVVSIIQIGTLILNTIVVLILINSSASIHIVKLASSLIFVLRPILQNIYVRKKCNINLKDVKEVYKIQQKWDGLAQHIAYIVHNNTDVIILTLCRSLADVSVYSVYLMIVNSVKNIVASFVGGLDSTLGDMIARGEHENLNRSFKVYEAFYFTIATILFGSTLFLIVPFVKIYTQGVLDANYIRPTFAYLMVLVKFVFTIRQPYNDLVKVSGHFKQTKIGAWVEAFSNITISLILVWKYGIVGVAIGTLFAMCVRTIEFMCYTSKHILKRNIWVGFKNLIIIIVEIVFISIIMNFIPKFEVYSYETWVVSAIYVFVITLGIVIFINSFVHKDSLKIIKKMIRIAK